MFKRSVAHTAPVLRIAEGDEPAGMRAFPLCAADRANSGIAGKILVRRMLLMAFLANAASVIRPAVLMRAGQQGDFIRFHIAPQNGTVLPDGTMQITALLIGLL